MINDAFPQAEFHAAFLALQHLQAAFEEAPQEDWRASQGWWAVENASDKLWYDMFEATEARGGPPPGYKHWREIYSSRSTM